MTSRKALKTRTEILDATADEILRQGVRSARLDKILARAGVTKGALYHHFGSKRALVHAVLDELLGRPLLERWQSVAMSENPLAALDQLLAADATSLTCGLLARDTTVSALALQCGGSDSDTRLLLENIHERWRKLLASALRAGQDEGKVDPALDAELTSDYLIATYEGILNIARMCGDSARLASLMTKLRTTVAELEPTRETRPARSRVRTKSKDSDFLFLGSPNRRSDH